MINPCLVWLKIIKLNAYLQPSISVPTWKLTTSTLDAHNKILKRPHTCPIKPWHALTNSLTLKLQHVSGAASTLSSHPQVSPHMKSFSKAQNYRLGTLNSHYEHQTQPRKATAACSSKSYSGYREILTVLSGVIPIPGFQDECVGSLREKERENH